MPKKLTLILGFAATFAIGCATASVFVDAVAADPAHHECLSVYLHSLTVQELADPAKAAKKTAVLPSDWTVVGGGSAPNGMTTVVLCR